MIDQSLSPLIFQYPLLNIRIFDVNLKHLGCFFFYCCLQYVCCSAAVLLLVTALLLFLLVKTVRQLLTAPCTGSGASFIIYRKVSTMDVRKRLTHLTMISHERPHIATASLCPPPTCILASGKGGCRCACIKHGEQRGRFWTWQRKWKWTAPRMWLLAGIRP